jgi:hypothetical protein
MKRIQTNLILVFTLLITVCSLSAQADDDILNNVREALKSSNSSELAKYLNDRVEIKLESERKEYSVNQAEIVLKQFFQKHPADDTEFIHEGTSPGGIIYAIGNYTSGNSSYRVVLRAKKYKSAYKIYRLEFSNSR